MSSRGDKNKNKMSGYVKSTNPRINNIMKKTILDQEGPSKPNPTLPSQTQPQPQGTYLNLGNLIGVAKMIGSFGTYLILGSLIAIALIITVLHMDSGMALSMTHYFAPLSPHIPLSMPTSTRRAPILISKFEEMRGILSNASARTQRMEELSTDNVWDVLEVYNISFLAHEPLLHKIQEVEGKLLEAKTQIDRLAFEYRFITVHRGLRHQAAMLAYDMRDLGSVYVQYLMRFEDTKGGFKLEAREDEQRLHQEELTQKSVKVKQLQSQLQQAIESREDEQRLHQEELAQKTVKVEQLQSQLQQAIEAREDEQRLQEELSQKTLKMKQLQNRLQQAISDTDV